MKKQELKELLTPEFLSTLHTAVECCGWSRDMIESMNFCDWCYNMAGQPEPEYDMSFKMEDE
ncbi:MAG: hypothetical protein SCG72_03370 [Nitrosarchaeum sp.]|nr:hypothetical protein [Nitrosarchaeum sp.]